MPLAFFVSSRYRLPFAATLAIPAGVGLAAIVSATTARRKRSFAIGILLVVVSLSLLAPTGGLAETSEAVALAARASAWDLQGEPAKAETDLKRALTLDPGSVPALGMFSKFLSSRGRSEEFRAYYERALAAHESSAGARWQTEILGLVARGNLAAAWQTAESVAARGIEIDPEIRGKLERAVRQPASVGGERR
jgi:tetratricopeptide (TPR) repeat protein